MPPKASGKMKASKATIVAGDGKKKPVFEADYASAREKRLTALRSHANLQFNYDGIARPSLLHPFGSNNGLDDDGGDGEDGFGALTTTTTAATAADDEHTDERLWVHAVETTDKGRILVNDIAFKPGDVIFRETPLAKASWHDFHCHECALPHDYGKCRQFLGVYGKDSAVAKRMMDIEDELSQFEIIGDLDRARLYIKLIWLWGLCPEANCWTELTKLTTAGTRKDEYMRCVKEFRNKLVIKNSGLIPATFTDDHLATLLAVLNNNSHEIEGFGSGIWLYASLLEHSCQANCNFVTTENELILIAIADIPVGTSLTIDYNVATYKPYKARQESYNSHYGFTCTCSMCTVGYDKPRSFHCPQAMRYVSSFAQANGVPSISMGQFDPATTTAATVSVVDGQPPIRHLVDAQQNNIQNDIRAYRIKVLASLGGATTTASLSPGTTTHPIPPFYSFDSLELTPSRCPFTSLAPNPAAAPETARCIGGVVQPIGDGSNTQQWKCSGCGYHLTEAEIAICLDFESKIQPPPSVQQGDEYDDIFDMFALQNYSLPTQAQVNDSLSYAVIHPSHSAVYWTLYVLALKWTKKATDACYEIESSSLRQKLNQQKKAKAAAKKGGKKLGRGQGQAQQQQLHTISRNNPEDTIAEEDLDKTDAQLRAILNFFSAGYEPMTHSAEQLQKIAQQALREQHGAMGDELSGGGGGGGGGGGTAPVPQAIPHAVELPLLCEHLWTLVAEGASANLHPLHPELLVIYDYLAQVQILKRRTKRAKVIWSYCYHLSTVINSTLSKETYKLKRLVTHTPTTIAQLQHHYSTIEELYQKLQFHKEDTATAEVLQQFTLTAIDSDGDDDDDLNSLVNAMSGDNGKAKAGVKNNNQTPVPIAESSDDDDDDLDDADELLLRSQFGKSIIKNAQKHQTTEQQVRDQNQQQQQQNPGATPVGQAMALPNAMAPSAGPGFGSGFGGGFGSSPAPATGSTNMFDMALNSTAPAPAPTADAPFKNSFGFSSSVLFAKGGTAGPGPSTASGSNAFSTASNFTVNSFGSAVFNPGPSSGTTPAQPQAFAGGGFGSLTTGNQGATGNSAAGAFGTTGSTAFSASGFGSGTSFAFAPGGAKKPDASK